MWMLLKSVIGPISREHRSESRFARVLPCPLRAGQRRGVLRGTSLALQRGDRRDATAGSGAIGKLPDGCCRWVPRAEDVAPPIHSPLCRCGRSSTIFAGAWSASALLLLLLGSWIFAPGCWARLVRWCFPDYHAAGIPADPGRCIPKTSGVALGHAPSRVGRGRGTAVGSGIPHPGVSAVRRFHEPGRHRPDALPRSLRHTRQLLEWQTSSEAERNARTDLAGFYATMWSRRSWRFIGIAVLPFRQSDQLLWRSRSWACGWPRPGWRGGSASRFRNPRWI